MRGRVLGAEALGTFMLVFIGPGATAVNRWSDGAVTQVGVALAFGLVILAAVYALGRHSGAHLNPAVTLGLWVGGRFPARRVPGYVGAQIGGAVIAAGLLRWILGDAAAAAATAPSLAWGPALLVEVVLTVFLMLVVLAVSDDAGIHGAVAGGCVGATVAFDALMGGPLTGASMNPARSFGPALASNVWTGHWIYWAGPAIGSVLAVLLNRALGENRSDGRR